MEVESLVMDGVSSVGESLVVEGTSGVPVIVAPVVVVIPCTVGEM